MKAVIIARVSSREQEEGHSIDAQLKSLKEYCERKNLNILKTYQITESSTKGERKRFYEVIEYIKGLNETVALVAETVDRIQRSFVETVFLGELIERQKIVLHFIREGMILDKNANSIDILRWDYGVMSAKSYILNLKDNVKRSLSYRRNNGEWTNKAPIGYLNSKDNISNKNTVIVDKERAFLIKKAFNDYATGDHSIGELAKLLNKWGLKNKDNPTKPLSKSQVHNMLKNRFYCGYMMVEDKEIKHKYEPLIDALTFNKCQKITEGWHKKPFKYSEKPFIFRRLIKCGYCGCTISTERKKDKYNYLSCSKYNGNCDAVRVKEEDAIEQVKDVLKKMTIPEDVLKIVKDSLSKSIEAKKDYQKEVMDRLNREYNSLQSKRDTLLDMCVNQSITTSEYDKKACELKQKQYELGELLKAHTDADEKFGCTVSALIDVSSRAYDLFESSKEEQKRKIINFVLQNLSLKGKKLEYSIRKPFDVFVEASKCSGWLGD